MLINGHFVYLGRVDDPEVQNRYDQTIAEWLARGRQLATHQSVIIAEVVAAYWQHALTYYVRPDGTPSGGLDRVRNALKVLRDMYGSMPAAEFGPLKLRALREKWLSSDRKRARRTVNGYIAEVKHMFKWAISNTQNYERIGQINISASGVPLGYEEVNVCQSPPEIGSAVRIDLCDTKIRLSRS